MKAKMQAEEDEAKRLEEQESLREEQQQQIRRRWGCRPGTKPSSIRWPGAKPSSSNNLSHLESLWPPVDAGKGSIAPECNAAIESKRQQIEHRIRGRRRFNVYRNKVNIQSCSSDEDDAVGPWEHALPQTKPMYNKLCRDANGTTVVRNIRVDYHAHMSDKVIGNVYRCAHDTMMEIYDGQRLGIELSWRTGSDLRGRIKGGHHYGKDRGIPAAHKDTRFVYIGVRKMHWATVGNIAFQGFAWPFEAKKCKSIVRALFSNHCRWADVLVARGRCFSSRPGRFASNRILENLLWHWKSIGRPYLVYKEGCTVTGGGDPVPKWLVDNECYCSDFCQCNLVG